MNGVEFHTLGAWAETGDRIAVSLASDRYGRVLLQFRDDFPQVALGGFWGLFGGHVEPGEAISDAASREMAEETGLVFPSDRFIPFVRLFSENRHRHFVYRLDIPVDVSRIRLGEGAGFACIHAGQMHQFNLLPAAQSVLEYYFVQKHG